MSILKKYTLNLINKPSANTIKLPFGLRLGGVIDINTPFFIFNALTTKVKDPGDKLYIEAISRYHRKDCNIYNLYVESAIGDDYILQVDFDLDLKFCAAKLFYQTHEIYSQNVEELSQWENQIIGDEYIRLPDGVEYDREWEPGRRGHISGYKMDERLFSESFSSYHELQRLMMLYSRPIGDDVKEYLLVSSIHSSDKDVISVMAGINLNVGEVKFN